jgi:oxygen-dependent protoporphyrinogen oxidase
LTAAPISQMVARWPKSMAQYTLGHKHRVEEIRAHAAAIPGLHLAGNAFDGIGIPDCIQTGRAAAKAALTSVS